MSKFFTFLIGLVLGVAGGGALIFYLFVGAPRAAKVPGAPILPPDANTTAAPATATVVLKQEFFNEILKTIFRDMNAPSFPLNLSAQNEATDSKMMSFALQQPNNGCDSKITLKPEGSGTQTSVRFENGQILAPLAFTGSYNVPFVGCTNFTGWAEANLRLNYDPTQQTVFGQVDVQTVNLDGITPLASGIVTPLVQNSINSRVNPIQILRGEQIALKLPITATNGTLNANVKDVRAEIKDNALSLYVIYDLTGTKQ
ncbi:MAG: hypothetical protein ABI954_02140 [Pyrinomonadaceae bacterium]